MAKITNDTTPEPVEPDGSEGAAVRPSEQLAMTPAPVSASAAASGGATGLTDVSSSEPSSTLTDRTNTSVFRRHPIATGIAVGAIAVVIACGLTAWGVGTAVTDSLTSQSRPAAPSTATPAPNANGIQGGPVAGGRIAFRATIQSIGESNWTILTKRGQTVSVAINGSTQFGTKRASESASSFAVGDSVLIVATRANGAATAVRIVNAADIGHPAPTPTPTSTATT